jgi:hypothetical protein
MFDFDGQVVMVVWNITGRLHNSDAAWFGGFYNAIHRLLDGYCTVADLAFVGGVGNEKYLLRVLKSNELVPAEMSNSKLLHLEKELTKLHKSTERENNGLQQVCKCLNCKLSFEDAKNMEMLELSIYCTTGIIPLAIVSKKCIRGRDVPSLHFPMWNALEYYSKSPHFPLNCVDYVGSTIIFHYIF